MKPLPKAFFFIIFFLCFSIHTKADNADKGTEKAGKVLEDKIILSPKAKDALDSAIGALKKVYHGGADMLKGFGQGFGLVTKDYHYSFRVFNDAPAPIFVAEERLTGFMGATFQGEIKKGLVIGPNGNSGDEFLNRQLYVSVWICADTNQKELQKYGKSSKEWAKWGAVAGAVSGMGIASPLTAALGAAFGALAGSIATVVKLEKYKLYEKNMYPWSPNDDNVYYYRVYTHKNTLKAEYLDLVGTTSAFSGQFINNTKKDILLTFSKDTKEYAITLEPGSFSLLESSEIDYSIRPPQGDHGRGFQFYAGSATPENAVAFIPISPDGIGDVVNAGTEEKPKLVVAGPKLYSYEVFEGTDGIDVSVQGLSIGNYDQPVSGKIRDINPVECHLWYKSAQQAKAKQDAEKKKEASEQDQWNAIFFDLPETVWIMYKTKDFVLQEKIMTGSVIDFNLIRPQLREGGSWLYIVSVQTTDEAKAKKFLDRLNNGDIGQKALYTAINKPIDKDHVLSTIQKNTYGFIEDTEGMNASGITGVLLLADWFSPQGLGVGPFYYELDPGLLRIDQFANCIWFDKEFYSIDPKTGSPALKKTVMQELSEKLPQWITQYRTNQSAAQAGLRTFLLEKGNKGLFVDAQKAPANRQLTDQGTAMYQTLLAGPISIVQYPIMRKSGINHYVYTLGDKPEGWPA
jgi:hypothetical protein